MAKTLNAAEEPCRIRLAVEAKDDGYVATRIDPYGRPSEPFPLTLPLTAQDAADLRWYLETYVQFPGTGDRAAPPGSRPAWRTGATPSSTPSSAPARGRTSTMP